MQRILLLDDEVNVLMALKRALRMGLGSDVRVEVTSDPQIALARLGEAVFDLVVSDYRMPVMDGLEFLKRVRAVQPHTVRVMLSASSDYETLMRAVNDAEVYRFLAKPWQQEALIAQVRSALERAASARGESELADAGIHAAKPRMGRRKLGIDFHRLTESFAGVGNPHAIVPLPHGATVVDIGSGAGTDLLLAALHVGPHGRAVGVDMTEAMRDRARRGAEACGLAHVDVREGDATALPVESRSVDVVISNGVLNLVGDKRDAIAEIRRVLKPGGQVQIADIVMGVELPEDARKDIDLWTG